jgi:hypothetical protein
MLFALNLDEHLIYEESITISLMSSTQSGCVFRSELVVSGALNVLGMEVEA